MTQASCYCWKSPNEHRAFPQRPAGDPDWGAAGRAHFWTGRPCCGGGGAGETGAGPDPSPGETLVEQVRLRGSTGAVEENGGVLAYQGGEAEMPCKFPAGKAPAVLMLDPGGIAAAEKSAE